MQGRLFGGSFAASGTLTPKGTGAELKLHAELASGRMDQLSQSLAGRVLAKGPFTFVVDVSGEGLSPPGLVAGLSGEGALFLDPGTLQALSPEPLKRVALDANRSKKIKLDKDQIAARMSTLQDTLTRGTYAYAGTALPFGIKNGTLKLDPAVLAGKGAETTINGYVELGEPAARQRVGDAPQRQQGRRRASGESRLSRVSPGRRRHHLGGRHRADGDLPHRAAACRPTSSGWRHSM